MAKIGPIFFIILPVIYTEFHPASFLFTLVFFPRYSYTKFGAGLGFSNNVQSPTYPILNEYSDSNKFIYHFDLYRLKSVSEFLEIGGIEYLSDNNGICIIEWPELIESFDIDQKIKIFFRENNDKNSRTIEVYR